jgi:hypothetical protein
MAKLKTFNEFLNEGEKEDELKKSVAKTLGGLLTGDTEFLMQFSKNLGLTTPQGETASGTTTNTGAGGSKIPTTSPIQNTPETTTGNTETSISNAMNATSGIQSQGNDDFVLYMQHQQGPAGATGIVKALEGTGKMAKDTVATKKGTKYANLVMNVPSDRPQVKSAIIKALDKGDQKTAAGLFLSMWKEKWFAKQKQAKVEIEKPKNGVVKSAIKKYSAMYKVPFDFAITVAMIESGLNPKSGNATYKGLYAMVPTSNYNGATFAMGAKWSDPEVNANAGIKLLAHDITLFRKGLGSTVHALNLGNWSANLA